MNDATNGRNVYILDSVIVPDAWDSEMEAEILSGFSKVSLLHLRSEEEFVPYAPSADAIIMWHHLNLTRLSISRLSRARVIVRNGVGVDNVDLEAAYEFGIPVCNVPDYGTEEVADHTLAMLLSLWRRLDALKESVRSGAWDWRVAEPVRRIRGTTFGIVGCGRIGTAAARRAKVFGFEVAFYDPYVPSGYEKAIAVKRVNTLEELLERSDVVSLHVPLTDGTFHLIGLDQLQRMKPSAFLVNTSRGPVIDEKALVVVAQSGRLAGVALDVVETEPNPPRELLELPNFMITPHAAFYSVEGLREIRQKSASIVLDALAGRELRNVVSAK